MNSKDPLSRPVSAPFAPRFVRAAASKLTVMIMYQVIKVQEAREWQSRPGTPIKQQEYDWTWGTDYAGSCRWMSAADVLTGVSLDRVRRHHMYWRVTLVAHPALYG